MSELRRRGSIQYPLAPLLYRGIADGMRCISPKLSWPKTMPDGAPQTLHRLVSGDILAPPLPRARFTVFAFAFVLSVLDDAGAALFVLRDDVPICLRKRATKFVGHRRIHNKLQQTHQKHASESRPNYVPLRTPGMLLSFSSVRRPFAPRRFRDYCAIV